MLLKLSTIFFALASLANAQDVIPSYLQPNCGPNAVRKMAGMVPNPAPEQIVCQCNCCKNGQSCVQKTAALGTLSPEEFETCDCNCPGLTSLRGPTGCRGPPGLPGRSGQQGQRGTDGKRGLHGVPGDAGKPGRDGRDQPDGQDGGSGLPGIDGVTGVQGLQGEPGVAGNAGLQGLRGDPGVVGPQGPPGDKGDRGDKGPRGMRGSTGLRGLNGDKGSKGPRGKKGPRGLQGDAGCDGVSGKRGLPGLPGVRGDKGVAGKPGQDGPRGHFGEPGEPGLRGEDGTDSTLAGEPGEPGDNGDPGEDGGISAEFDWHALEVLVAEHLYDTLHLEKWTDIPEEICECAAPRDTRNAVLPMSKLEDAPVEDDKTVMDMVILVDGSDSISLEDWSPLKKWILKFIHHFNTSQMRQKYSKFSAMVVVQYSSHANYWQQKRMFEQLKELDQQLENMVQMAMGTDTYLALEYVLDDIMSNISTDVTSKIKAKNVDSALLLITNGLARDQSHEDNATRKYSNENLLRLLDNTFKQRLVVGVGSDIAKDSQQIQEISGGKTFWQIDSISCNGENNCLDQELTNELTSYFD